MISEVDRIALLELKGVGPAVLQRIEEAGFNNLDDLVGVSADELVQLIANQVGSTCWRNSPQAKAAIVEILTYAENRDI